MNFIPDENKCHAKLQSYQFQSHNSNGQFGRKEFCTGYKAELPERYFH